MSAVAAVERQLEAYNARDLERFLAEYADDIEAFRPPAREPALSGKAAFGAFYSAERFDRPGLRAELLARVVLGDKVVDHERIHGVREAPFEVVVAYELAGGRIRRTWTFAAG